MPCCCTVVAAAEVVACVVQKGGSYLHPFRAALLLLLLLLPPLLLPLLRWLHWLLLHVLLLLELGSRGLGFGVVMPTLVRLHR